MTFSKLPCFRPKLHRCTDTPAVKTNTEETRMLAMTSLLGVAPPFASSVLALPDTSDRGETSACARQFKDGVRVPPSPAAHRPQRYGWAQPRSTVTRAHCTVVQVG